MKNKKKKILIASLLGMVVCLGIGFAAFSTTLKINGSAKVSPNGENYKVFFVSSVNSLTRYDRGDFDGEANSDKVDPGKGHFEDDTTFTNTGVTFSEDGQSVDYKFYILNAGKYDAHITNLDIGNKTCTPGEDADASLAASACSSINLSVILGDEDNQTTYTSSQTISDHILPKGTWEQIIVRITYPEGSPLADGDLEVTWEDISFLTATSTNVSFNEDGIDDFDIEIDSQIKVISGDINTIGSEVAIGPEHFYVIGNNKDDSSKVNLLAKYNLLVGNNYSEDEDINETDCINNGGYWESKICNYNIPIVDTTEGYNRQSSNALGEKSDVYNIYNKEGNVMSSYTPATKEEVLSSLTKEQWDNVAYIDYSGKAIRDVVLPFSEIAYWSDGELLKNQYGMSYDAKPFIYDSNSDLYYYVEEYKKILENDYELEINDARILTYQEAVSLGCNAEDGTCITEDVINNNNMWIFNTSFWIGNAFDSESLWTIYSYGSFYENPFDEIRTYGVRPVITISKNSFE